MMTHATSAPEGTILIGMAPGDLLLENVREAVKEHDVKEGIVVSGIGTLDVCRLHFIMTSGFPPEEKFVTIEKHLELVQVSGLIIDHEPHLHVTVSCEDKEVYAGHLEDGSRVLYLAELAILKLTPGGLTRKMDTERRIKLLTKPD